MLSLSLACLPSLMPLFVLATDGTLRGRSDFARGSSRLSRARNNTVGNQLRTLPKNWKVGTEDGFRISQAGRPKRGDADTDEYPFLWQTESNSDPSVDKRKAVQQRRN